MTRSVRVGDFQRMQRVATTASASDQAESPPPTLTVPEQLATLDIHATPGSTYADVVKRIGTRCTLLDIPALDEEIAAEARRRCGMLPEPTASVHMLAGLVLQDDISGMPLGQVVGLVRLAARAAHLSPTESEIRDEADRRWQAAQPEPTVEDAIAAAEGLPLYADAPDEVIMSLGQDDPAGDPPLEPKAERRGRYAFTEQDYENQLEDKRRQETFSASLLGEAPVEPRAEDQADSDPEPMEDRLADLDVGARCTAEMPLSMIVGRVKDAAVDAKLDPTDAEVVAEAERIWATFSDNRRGPREATVNADGTVHDWRRPDNTPDRGPDVGTTHHTLTDDEPRFSGAGAGQARQVSTLIPADKDFGGKPFREASELVALADELIGEHGYFDHLEHCSIRYFWRRKTGVSKGQRITGGLDRGSGLKGFLLGSDFAIWLAADTARERQFDDRRVRRHLFRQLRRIGQDDKGNWIELPYTLQIFTEEITEFADVGDDDLRIGRGAFRNADQMGLFSDADDDDEPAEDDGAGVLIHDDGTPLSADEIAEMEEAELHGEEEDDEDSDPNELQPYDDEPADPDGPAPDEDPLADVDL